MRLTEIFKRLTKYLISEIQSQEIAPKHGNVKTKFIKLCLFLWHAMFWVLRYFQLKFHTPIGILVLNRQKFVFFSFVKVLWLCMSMHHLYSSRLYLILLGDMNRALAYIWYWVTELPKSAKVQMESQNFVVKVKKINLIKFDLTIDRTEEFFANHMHLIMGNYLAKLFFYNFVKKNVVNRNMS